MLPFDEKKTKKCNWHLDSDSGIGICGGHGGHILQIAIQRQLRLFQEPLSHFWYPVKGPLVYSLTYTQPTNCSCYPLIKSRGNRKLLMICSALIFLLFIWICSLSFLLLCFHLRFTIWTNAAAEVARHSTYWVPPHCILCSIYWRVHWEFCDTDKCCNLSVPEHCHSWIALRQQCSNH